MEATEIFSGSQGRLAKQYTCYCELGRQSNHFPAGGRESADGLDLLSWWAVGLPPLFPAAEGYRCTGLPGNPGAHDAQPGGVRLR